MILAGPHDGPAATRAPEGLSASPAITDRVGDDRTGADLAALVRSYDPRADGALVERAYEAARLAHAAQRRENGDPYIGHPVEVARVLAGYRLDAATVATALLHDTVEDTGLTLAELRARFGGEVARLVDGVTKLTRLEVQSERTKQAENFRKLVLAMSEDIRVLLVKLADRLHNMRTLGFVAKPEKRARVARETMEIYAPLAERIGMEGVKTELQSLAFRELQPDAWQTINARLAFLRGQGADLIEEIGRDLRARLAEAGVPPLDVQGREKSAYSIWLKMHEKRVEFEQLSDIMAFRVVVPDRAACYAALGVAHSAYRVVPGRFKDYISTPKPNGYRSLHTGVTVPGRDNAKIEVQFRTPEMHEVAEYGLAAHWIYKQGAEEGAARGSRRYPWVKDLLDILENAGEAAQDFLEDTKLALHQDQVFCFTPKGDLIALPKGATPVDFAYAVHSAVGDACVGAKINGQIKPLRQPLANGDQVEVITARGGTPNPAWERFVVSGKARARIRRFVLARQREEARESGRAAIARAFRQEGLDFTDKAAEPALKALRQASFDDLLVAVHAGHVAARDVLLAAYPELRGPPRASASAEAALPLTRARGKPGQTTVPPRQARNREVAHGITGLVAGMAVSFAGCCHPVPGDRIVGVVSTGRGVTIHNAACHSLAAFAATPERFLDVDWDTEAGAVGGHVARLAVVTAAQDAAVAALTVAIGRQEGRIQSLRFLHRAADFHELQVDLEVRDLRHLSGVVAALRACPGVEQVERAKA